MLLVKTWASISILNSIFSTSDPFSTAAGDAEQREAGADPILWEWLWGSWESPCWAQSYADASCQGRASLPCLGEPGWTCPAGCVISTGPLLPLLAEHSKHRDELKMPESVPGAEMILLALLLNISFEPSSELSQTGSRALEQRLHEWDDKLSSA